VPGPSRAGDIEYARLCSGSRSSAQSSFALSSYLSEYSHAAAGLLSDSTRTPISLDHALRAARLGGLDPSAIRGGVRPCVNARPPHIKAQPL
jgi:hypothetical protein